MFEILNIKIWLIMLELEYNVKEYVHLFLNFLTLVA